TRTLVRWLNRHRTGVTGAAAAGIVALIGLGVVSAVQTQARYDLAAKNADLDIQRRRAEANEKQAIDAVKRFGEVIAEEPLLKDTRDLVDLRNPLLQEPLTFFRSLRERLQADRDTRPEAVARLARACHELGFLTDEIGDEQDALTGLRESVAIY